MLHLTLYVFVQDYPGLQRFSAETKHDADTSVA